MDVSEDTESVLHLMRCVGELTLGVGNQPAGIFMYWDLPSHTPPSRQGRQKGGLPK